MLKKALTFSLIFFSFISIIPTANAEAIIKVEPVIKNELNEGYLTSYALELINKKREAAGLPLVRLDINLENLAKDYAKKMADSGYASHSVDGKNMKQRAIDFGIQLSKDFSDNNFTENIAWGSYGCLQGCKYTPETELERRVNEFVNEKKYNGPHYRTIFHRDFNAVGIGIHFIKSSETKGKFFVAWEYAKLDSINSPAIFSDVPSNSPYYDGVKFLKEKDVVKGYDNFFKPNDPITRVEAVKILFDAFEMPLISRGKINFSDVDKEDWFHPYVLTAVKRDFVSGFGDETFKPNNNISRVEALKMALDFKSVGLDNSKFIAFKDVHEEDWFNPYIAYAYENNLMAFYSQEFGVDKVMTRGEFAKMLYILKDK